MNNETTKLTAAERKTLFARIWKGTHRDFRGTLADGSKSLMSWAKYGGGLVTVDSMSDAELRERGAA